MHLLDTAVVWELRGAKAGRGDPALTQWALAQARTTLLLSAMTLAELGAGAAQIERADKVGAAAIRRWIVDRVLPAFDGRILPVDAQVARRATELGYADMRDGLIAATALEHGLTLATRHEAAFRAGRVKTVNPWGYTADPAGDDSDWRQATRAGPLWLKNLFVRG
ncbi:PIN domain-containing protein [Sphingomonas sp. TREG-RG-20F-R18-01]|uniref:PIN domain-containing protein n=1 Tax=Sphingomonas sp. TREG-RG-20F-R18-01 TaxID=2914982 RepID=UPI001F59C830|nr:PIN domain-containing protein [Sphingomonas sp. TREG-RG-20F-R18-01]